MVWPLALMATPALAQAPSGPVPTSAVAQRTEPGRYWVFFGWNRAELPPDGRKMVEAARTGRMGDGKIFVLSAQSYEAVLGGK